MELNNIISKKVLLFLYFFEFVTVFSVASALAFDSVRDQSSIMFVGEDLDVLCVASRREESAWEAPAVATVVTASEMRDKGYHTLSDALGWVPGFYMARKEWGSQSYQRGIQDSTLFLYDTVPLGSEISKSFSSLNENLSLAPIKRIEIVSGPGSVLWGPDAFAGIVNMVPLTGRDFTGVEFGGSSGIMGGANSAYINMGGVSGETDGFLSVTATSWEDSFDRSANIVKFWGNDTIIPVLPSERHGQDRAGSSKSIDMTGNASWNDRLSISGRFSRYSVPYTRSDQGLAQIWKETRDVTSGFFKMDSTSKYGLDSALRFTAIYSWINPETRIIDLDLDQKEKTFYAETALDKTFFEKSGVLTSGVSWRYKDIKDAPVWNGYFPDYLGDENYYFLPSISNVDSMSRMWSVFAQYRHTFGRVSLWGGVRKDVHEIYGNPQSNNIGISWNATDSTILRLIYGTAYRTPTARQLLEIQDPEMENIRNLSANISCRASESVKGSLTCFLTKIDDHVLEDPNIGASDPNNQKIWGGEFNVTASVPFSSEIGFNLTWIQNSGPWETYRYNDYSYEVDGEMVKHYVNYSYPYDIGSPLMAGVSWLWHVSDDVFFYTALSYRDQSDVLYPLKGIVQRYSSPWIVDANLRVKDCLFKGLDWHAGVKNLLDERYEVPGVYGTLEGERLRLITGVDLSW